MNRGEELKGYKLRCIEALGESCTVPEFARWSKHNAHRIREIAKGCPCLDRKYHTSTLAEKVFNVIYPNAKKCG